MRFGGESLVWVALWRGDWWGEPGLGSNHNGTATQSSAQATPLEANPKGTAHRAQRMAKFLFKDGI